MSFLRTCSIWIFMKLSMKWDEMDLYRASADSQYRTGSSSCHCPLLVQDLGFYVKDPCKLLKGIHIPLTLEARPIDSNVFYKSVQQQSLKLLQSTCRSVALGRPSDFFNMELHTDLQLARVICQRLISLICSAQTF